MFAAATLTIAGTLAFLKPLNKLFIVSTFSSIEELTFFVNTPSTCATILPNDREKSCMELSTTVADAP